MNIINRLTIRHMVKNKRRTFVTIIGIIISVAMIMAVTTLASSFLNFAKENHIANEGEWHALYKNVTKAQLDAIQSDPYTEKVILSRDLGYSYLENDQNPSKPYLFFKQYNADGFKQFPIEVIEGDFPKNNKELLIAEHVMTNELMDWNIGDQLTVNIGDRVDDEGNLLGQTLPLQTIEQEVVESIDEQFENKYTIVGIMKRPTWEPYQAPGYTALTYMSNQIEDDTVVNATVVWNKVNQEVLEHAEKLREDLSITDMSVHDSLLRYDGLIKQEFIKNSLYSVAAIVMSVIMIGAISLIYNAFAISVSERSRHLGMLSSVGATKKQKRNSVFFEGFILGIISIPFGIISGITGLWITFYFINPLIQDIFETSVKLTIVVTPMSIIVAILVSALTIFISTYIPAKRASKISAIDAIRQAKDVKLSKRNVKTSKLVRKIFGIEAEFGLKNLKRNKRRYIATLLSLIISIILFLTVSFFGDQMRYASDRTMLQTNYDIKILYHQEFNESFLENIRAMEEIKNYSKLTNAHIDALIPVEKMHESISNLAIDGFISSPLILNVLDDYTLREYTEQLGVPYETMNDKANLSAIIIDETYAPQDKLGGTKSIYLEKGDELKRLSHYDWTKDKEQPINEKLKVVEVTDKRPLGVDMSNIGTINVVISETTLNMLKENNSLDINPPAVVLETSDPIAVHDKLEQIVGVGVDIINHHKYQQEEEQIILLMSVFTYGFVALITLISVANIVNTISTSISLRTREFGMLKSVGMTPKGFNKMIHYESLFYGIQSLFFGLPISIGIMYLIYQSMGESFDYPFILPWGTIFVTIIAVFVVVVSTMLYSSAKVKKQNIIDALKQENI